MGWNGRTHSDPWTPLVPHGLYGSICYFECPLEQVDRKIQLNIIKPKTLLGGLTYVYFQGIPNSLLICFMEKKNLKWMLSNYPHDLGNLHISMAYTVVTKQLGAVPSRCSVRIVVTVSANSGQVAIRIQDMAGGIRRINTWAGNGRSTKKHWHLPYGTITEHHREIG